MLAEFIVQNKLFSYPLKEFSLILGIPIEGQCSFSNKWSIDNLEFSVPSSGPYQTTPPFPDDIKNYIQLDREKPLTRTHHGQTIDVEENEILTREIQTIMKTCADFIRENVFCLGGNRDHNDEGTSRASTPSPTRFVNFLSNEIPQVFSNPPDDEQTMQNFFTRQTKILNRQVQMRDEHRSGLRSIGKEIKNLWKGKKK
ncbi:hypothetical protein Tco_0668455 [Tanacetum coccineum]